MAKSKSKTGKIHPRHDSTPEDRTTIDEHLAAWLHALYEAYRDRTETVSLPDMPDEAVDQLTEVYRRHFLAKKPSYQDRVDAANSTITHMAGVVHSIRLADSGRLGVNRGGIPPMPISYFSGPRD